MRLIDADNLFIKLKENDLEFMQQQDIMDCIKDTIDREPTAYDVDKVVEQLEELREEILSDTAYDNDTVNYYLGYADLMIKAVKSGGTE